MKYILEEIKKHPKLNEQDLVKLIYQRNFGPKHILESPKAFDYLMNEVKGEESGYFEIGNNVIRVYLKEIEDYPLFFEKVLESARKITGNYDDYYKDIENLKHFIIDNKLNYDINLIDELKTKAPLHHSKAYNEAYDPHYRILDKNTYLGGRNED